MKYKNKNVLILGGAKKERSRRVGIPLLLDKYSSVLIYDPGFELYESFAGNFLSFGFDVYRMESGGKVMLNFDRMRDQKTAYFVSFKDASAAALFYEEFFREAALRSGEKHEYPICVFMPALEGVSSFLNAFRKSNESGFLFVICADGISKLREAYGSDAGDIPANSGTIIVLKTDDPETAAWAKSWHTAEIKAKRIGRGKVLPKDAADVSLLSDDEAYIISEEFCRREFARKVNIGDYFAAKDSIGDFWGNL